MQRNWFHSCNLCMVAAAATFAGIGARRGFLQMAAQRAASAASARAAVRAVALDMDGTTLNSKHVLTEATAQTIRALQAKDIHVIIATGRPVPALQPYVNQLQLPKPVPVVCFNGAVVAELSPAAAAAPASASPPISKIFSQPLQADAVKQVIDFCRDIDVCVIFSLLDSSVAAPRTPEQEAKLQLFESLEGFKQRRLQDLDALLALREPPLKTVILTDDVQGTAAEARAKLSTDVVHITAAEMHVEFTDPTVSKGRTLKKFCCETLALEGGMEGVIAFGDNENDMQMLAEAGEGIAMRNAKDCVKDVAARTSTWTNDDEGVANELQTMIQQGRL